MHGDVPVRVFEGVRGLAGPRLAQEAVLGSKQRHEIDGVVEDVRRGPPVFVDRGEMGEKTHAPTSERGEVHVLERVDTCFHNFNAADSNSLQVRESITGKVTSSSAWL